MCAEYGESLEECAARELEEETGISLPACDMQLAYTTSTVFPEVGLWPCVDGGGRWWDRFIANGPVEL